MLGEIDLSVGSMSGLASALLGVLWVNHGWPVLVAIVAALVARRAASARSTRSLLNRLGMPSFVSTLAGLLALLGLQLYMLGLDRLDQPALRLGRSCSFGQLLVMPDWLSLRAGAAAGRRRCSSIGLRTMAQRRARRTCRPGSIGGLIVKAVVLTAGCWQFVVSYLNQSAAACRGCSASSSLLVVVMNYALHPHQVGPLDDGRRRQPRGGAPRRHQRAADLHSAPSCSARCSRRSAACWRRRGSPRRASRPAPATSTSTPSPRR